MFQKSTCLFPNIFFLLLFSLFASSLISGPNVSKIGETKITADALGTYFGNYYLNGLSFQQDAIITHNGWQYAAYYNSQRFVTVARRELSDSTWESVSLTDYKQVTNDDHNTISMGISPGDGTIHLSFDHHSSLLHYRKSIPDIATNPQNYIWSDTLFERSTYQLVSGQTVTQVTYPRFLSTPDGDLQFVARIGTSGDGENYMWEYSSITGEWASLGKFVDNPDGGNAYLHGITYDENGRFHTTWVKRLTWDPVTNHNLYYIYSDDQARTWYNDADSLIGTTGTDPIKIEEPFVWAIPTNSGLINQEAQTVDHLGRIHVFQRKDVGSKNYQFHYWRDLDGAWHEIDTGIATVNWYQRSKIAVDQDNNIYAIIPKLIIASASAASGYTDWSVVSEEDKNRFHSEPLYDWYRLNQGDGILSVVYQERRNGNLMVMDYELNSETGIDNQRYSQDINQFTLMQNYPNPFNPVTQFTFILDKSGLTEMTVYNQRGEKIARPLNTYLKAGRHQILFNGSSLPSGLYFYRLKSGNQIGIKKMLLIR